MKTIKIHIGICTTLFISLFFISCSNGLENNIEDSLKNDPIIEKMELINKKSILIMNNNQYLVSPHTRSNTPETLEEFIETIYLNVENITENGTLGLSGFTQEEINESKRILQLQIEDISSFVEQRQREDTSLTFKEALTEYMILKYQEAYKNIPLEKLLSTNMYDNYFENNNVSPYNVLSMQLSTSSENQEALMHFASSDLITRGLGRDICGLIGAAIGGTLGSFGGGIVGIWGGAYGAALAYTIYDGFDPVEFSNMVSSDPRTFCN